MENGKQIERRLEASKQIFLEEIQKEIMERKSYSVQDELDRASKNKNWRVIIILGLTITVFSVVILMMNWIVTDRYENAHIDITTFQNINLREILNITKQLEQQIDATIMKRNELLTEKNIRLETLNSQLTQSITQLESMRLSPAALSRRVMELRVEHEDTVAALNAELDPQIKEFSNELSVLRNNLSEYDLQQVETAQRQEEILANERRLFTLELNQTKQSYENTIEKLTENYEQEMEVRNNYFNNTLTSLRSSHRTELANTTRRYNPTFSSIRTLLLPETSNTGEPVEQADTELPLSEHEFLYRLQTNQYLPVEMVSEQVVSYDEYRRILQALENTPYQNDVPIALSQLNSRYESTLTRYQDLITVVSNQLTERINAEARLEEQISRILHALQSYSEENRTSGYIIDARDAQDIMIYIDKFVPLGEESIGYVSRGQDNLIGTIAFLPFDGYMRASLSDYIAPNTSFQPFDTIIVSWDDTGNASNILEAVVEEKEVPAEEPTETDSTELEAIELIDPSSTEQTAPSDSEQIENTPRESPSEVILRSLDPSSEEIPEANPASEVIEDAIELIQKDIGDSND